MNTATRIFASVALAALVTSPSSAHAAPALRTMPDATPGTIVADSSHVSAVLSSADALAASGRVSEAIRSLKTLAAEQHKTGEYAGITLRRLADLQYGVGDAFQAANTLDQLADEAGAFGDPTVRLRALFEAALVYQELKLYDRVPERTRQITTLLKSPMIDERIRSDIAARIHHE
jgi:predicted negative regulator of RcsB-dependent stress response